MKIKLDLTNNFIFKDEELFLLKALQDNKLYSKYLTVRGYYLLFKSNNGLLKFLTGFMPYFIIVFCTLLCFFNIILSIMLVLIYLVFICIKIICEQWILHNFTESEIVYINRQISDKNYTYFKTIFDVDYSEYRNSPVIVYYYEGKELNDVSFNIQDLERKYNMPFEKIIEKIEEAKRDNFKEYKLHIDKIYEFRSEYNERLEDLRCIRTSVEIVNS